MTHGDSRQHLPSVIDVTASFVSQRSTVAVVDHLLNLRRRLIALLQIYLTLNELLIVLIIPVVTRVHVAADGISSRAYVGAPFRAGQTWRRKIAAASTASAASPLLDGLLSTDFVVCVLVIASGADVRSPWHSR